LFSDKGESSRGNIQGVAQRLAKSIR
jgi:hypothetical protein